jgi:nucleoside-diphosphate-sugar epimerase
VPGEGTSLWTLTHADDVAAGIVGLLGRTDASGHAFNATSPEALTWNEIHALVAAAAGAELRPAHIPSTFLAEALPDIAGRLVGDAAHSSAFDSGKLAAWVPGFRPGVRLADGLRRTVAWFEADPARRAVDDDLDARWDAVIEAWQGGVAHARSGLAGLA